MFNYSFPSSIPHSQVNGDNTFKILIATDCHLGYEETDRIIGEDSFITFEEILGKAAALDVDMILLGGDLFHHNNPSQKTMNKCIELLRQYTLGEVNSRLELLSTATEVFSHCITQTANFLDENIKVKIPVFSIHGNHDDPSGIGQQSSMDTLSSTGLINYFGKCTHLSNIKINPIIIKKGETYLALYGLGHISDDRLCRLFMDKKVKFTEPEEWPNSCFRILVIHQNRADRGPKRFISESFIPSFFDIVIWGHEHDCRIEPELNIENNFFVVQPGSTVVTSLCEGEALQKHIGVIEVWKDLWSFRSIKLNTVRPFIWKSVLLSEIINPNDKAEVKSEKTKEYCKAQIEQMIQESYTRRTNHPKQPTLPLIRLRCEYTDESQLFNMVKFGQQFLNRIATPNLEIIKFKKLVDSSRSNAISDRSKVMSDLTDLYSNSTRENQNFSECISCLVKDYFTEHAESSLEVLNLQDLEEAVKKFLDKGETYSISRAVDQKMNAIKAQLMSYECNDEEDVERELAKIKEENEKSKNRVTEIYDEELPQGKTSDMAQQTDSDTDEYESSLLPDKNILADYKLQEEEEMVQEAGPSEFQSEIVAEPTLKTVKGRGRSGGRLRATGRGQTGNKKMKMTSL